MEQEMSENAEIQSIQQTKSSYIIQHWQGRLNLGVSFWINTILLLLLFRIAWIFFPQVVVSMLPPVAAMGCLLFVMLGVSVIAIWQGVGVWRSAVSHRREKKTQKTQKLAILYSYLAQIVSILMAVNILAFTYGFSQGMVSVAFQL